MFGIDDATAVAVMPTPEAAGTPGFFTEGNPALGQAATYVRASFLNALQQEMLNILTAGGITPSKTVYNQILTALRSNGLLYGVDTGVANACVVDYATPITAVVDGMVLWFDAAASNTGLTTLNVNGTGAAGILGGNNAGLQGGEIVAGGKCQVVWNASLTAWILIQCTGGALQIAPATKSQQAVALGQFVASKTANGYVTLPNGLILQWGSVTIPTTTGTLWTYPIAFPNAALSAHATLNTNSSEVIYITSFNGVNAVIDSAPGSVLVNAQMFAIGY